MAHTMILLVSGQPMPNLLAALDPELGVDKVELIVSGEMEVAGHAGHLADVLEARGVSVNTHMVADAFQPEATRTTVTALVKENPDRFILNLTGGTKAMVLGAYRAALDWGVLDLLYLDHEQGLLRWLDGNRGPQVGRARLNTAEILRAHGYSAKAGAPPSRSALQLAHSLHQQLTGDVLQLWNLLFTSIESRCSKDRQWTAAAVELGPIFKRDTDRAVALLNRPLREAAAMGFCTPGQSVQGADWVQVDRQADNQLLGGGWFELVVHAALQSLEASLGLDELSLNLKVHGPDGGANEFDCIARRGSRLLFFEAKTTKMSGPYGAGKPQDIFYKLNSLKGAGGLTGRACLVSVVPVQKGMIHRFAGAGLGLVQGDEAKPDRLRAALAAWIKAG